MLGIDIVENKRVGLLYHKYGDKFLKKVFTENEKRYCLTQKNPIPCLAARWAAKEAVIKAFYQYFGKKLFINQIEIIGSKGKPAQVVILSNEKELLINKKRKIIISIAHEKNYSVAIAQII